MATIIEITDLKMPELDIFTQLTESQLRNRLEPQKGIFIAESLKVIDSALAAGCEPVCFLMERKHICGQASDLLARWHNLPVYTADRDILQALTGYELTRGILCAMRRPQPACIETLCRQAKRLAVLENIVDATNIGAIFRSAAALHIDGVLLTPSCADPLNRRSVRVSMGTVFQVPWAQITDTAHWPVQSLQYLNNLGFRTIAMALQEDSLPIDDPKLVSHPKLAILLGTEGVGLSAQTIANCDYTAKIPMSHNVDSLNVAAAGAVAFWQLRVR